MSEINIKITIDDDAVKDRHRMWKHICTDIQESAIGPMIARGPCKGELSHAPYYHIEMNNGDGRPSESVGGIKSTTVYDPTLIPK